MFFLAGRDVLPEMSNMCVVALALNQHPDWPILLIGNRDEFHARASAPLAAWDDASGIIAGRDLVGGGTWLGVNPAQSRLVVVTNVRSEAAPDPDKASRGALVTDALTGSGIYADPLTTMLDGFNGFTLLRLFGAEASLLTNRPAPGVFALAAGIHAIANAPGGEDCPRANRLAEAVRLWIEQRECDPLDLLDALRDEDGTPLFLNGLVYGTRCSTVVAIDRSGQGRITERRYAKGGIPDGETALDFRFVG